MGTIDSIVIDSRVKGIIFDYGGTLDSRGDHWSHVILDGYRAAGLRIPTDAFIDAYIHTERALAVQPIITPSDNFRALMRKKTGIQMWRLIERGHLTHDDCGKSVTVADY